MIKDVEDEDMTEYSQSTLGLGKMKVPELKQRSRGKILSVRGNKGKLIVCLAVALVEADNTDHPYTPTPLLHSPTNQPWVVILSSIFFRHNTKQLQHQQMQKTPHHQFLLLLLWYPPSLLFHQKLEAYPINHLEMVRCFQLLMMHTQEIMEDERTNVSGPKHLVLMGQ